MSYKPIIVVLGEPHSTFPEIFLKSYNTYIKKFKRPIIVIGSVKLIEEHIKYFNYKIKLKVLHKSNINKIKNNKFLNIIDVNLKFKKVFKNNFKNSNLYISSCFALALRIIGNGNAIGLINGPISKKKFFKKKYQGVTEYLAKKIGVKKFAMLIYNKNLSVCPITTHLPLKSVIKQISKKRIIEKVTLLYKFYKIILKRNPKFAVLGLNPHCETIDNYSEEKSIIKPSIKYLKSKGVSINGPYPTDTFFINGKLKHFDVVIGMYHDQVLTPIKTIYKFDAINLTVGLPFIRVSPDHGPNEKMISKGISDTTSLIKAVAFFKIFNES